MNRQRNIFLTGYRTCGKTSVGRIVAEQTNLIFVDTDELVEKKAEKTISEIFKEQGEQGFRKIESNAVTESCSGNGKLVALGGGAILSQSNAEKIKNSGLVILLKASPETIKQRLLLDLQKNKQQRPGLTGDGLVNEIERVLSSRAESYERLSDFEIETDSLSVEEVAGKVIKIMEANGFEKI